MLRSIVSDPLQLSRKPLHSVIYKLRSLLTKICSWRIQSDENLEWQRQVIALTQLFEGPKLIMQNYEHKDAQGEKKRSERTAAQRITI